MLYSFSFYDKSSQLIVKQVTKTQLRKFFNAEITKNTTKLGGFPLEIFKEKLYNKTNKKSATNVGFYRILILGTHFIHEDRCAQKYNVGKVFL